VKLHRLRHWWLVFAYLTVGLAVMVLAFLPFNRKARQQSQRASQLSRELESQITLIESLPHRKTDLDQLQTQLSRFRSELAGTHEVDRVMSQLRERAEARGLELWTLNPSVPVLIQMEEGGDSLARLDLAVLPVSFECRGSFENVAHFLAAQESRADFYRWISLAITADPVAAGVQAKAEIRLFLLPPSSQEAAT
jgi:Tfp pilus assembly protein PilO